MRNLVQILQLFLILFIIFIGLFLTFFSQSQNIYKVGHHPNKKSSKEHPNIVFILTDDQDYLLDSLYAMPKLRKLLINKGTFFENSVVASPLCCPSRSSILTGQYVHNHKAFDNSVTGGCSSYSWQDGPERKSIAKYLHDEGYRTFFAGKYLNQYGISLTGGLKHIPNGWDWWVGLQGNSKYYNYFISVNGSKIFHGDNPSKDYLPNVMRNYAKSFLKTQNSDPFFMLLSTPSCHSPWTPESKYSNYFRNKSSPRLANFNIANDNSKHWLLRLGNQSLRKETIDKLDEIYRQRLRTLVTIDDMIEEVYNRLDELSLLSNTYFIFTSDNGYHLGEFSMPIDKREPYEFDIRVPLVFKGPGVLKRTTTHPVVNIDIAPTILDLANVKIPSHFDGTSLKQVLFGDDKIIDRKILIEHTGERQANNPCNLGPNLFGCSPTYECKCSDSLNNTYACIRETSHIQYIYCAWEDDENFEEFYDLNRDQSQLKNLAKKLPTSYLYKLRDTLQKYKDCSGSNCL